MGSKPSSIIHDLKSLKASQALKQPAIELVDDPKDLVLKLSRNRRVTINKSELDKLLQPQSGKGSYGLQSAQEVIDFLKSPAGKTTKKLINDQLALLVMLKEHQNTHFLYKELLRQLFIARLRFIRLAKRKAEAKALNAAYQRQIEKSLAYAKAIAAQRSSSNDRSQYGIGFNHLQIACEFTAKLIEDELQEKLMEAEELEQEIVAHEAEIIHFMTRYQLLDDHLQRLDDHSAQLAAILSFAERLEATRALLAVIQGGMQQVNNNIEQHLSQREDIQVRLLMSHLDGLSVQEEGLKTLLDVMNSQKIYYTAEGEKTDSHQKAAYVVANRYELYKDKETGKLYLLKPGQRFANMTLNEKAEAQQNYEQSKPEFRLIKDKVEHYKATEALFLTEKKNELATRREVLQKEIVDLGNQCNQTKAAAASAAAILQDLKTDLTPLPTPKPSPSFKTNKPEVKSQLSSTQSYREELLAMCLRPTVERIEHFKNRFLLPNGAPDTEAQALIANTIRPNKVLLPTQMSRLLERLNELVNKPSVTSIPNKPENQRQNGPRSPNPFEITPSPFK